MCVIALAWRVDPRWPLVFVGNRDERHDRLSLPLHRWADAPQVLAGRDQTAGGGWLGVSETGRLVTVTNVSGAPNVADRPSRGWLVRDMLTRSGAYAEAVGVDLAAFNPFNLVVVEPGRAGLWSNWPVAERTALEPGVHGLGNRGAFEEPTARVHHLKAGLDAWMAGASDELEPLFVLLAERRPFPGPDGAPEAPPIFLRNPVYGTRCSTVVRVAADGAGQIVERRFDPEGQVTGETALAFGWPADWAGTDQNG